MSRYAKSASILVALMLAASTTPVVHAQNKATQVISNTSEQSKNIFVHIFAATPGTQQGVTVPDDVVKAVQSKLKSENMPNLSVGELAGIRCRLGAKAELSGSAPAKLNDGQTLPVQYRITVDSKGYDGQSGPLINLTLKLDTTAPVYDAHTKALRQVTSGFNSTFDVSPGKLVLVSNANFDPKGSPTWIFVRVETIE